MATKETKQAVVEELVEILKNSDAVYIAGYKGINVKSVNALRNAFRKEGLAYKVYKNTLVKRAMQEVGGYDSAFHLLEEQNAFIFVKEELGKPAKVLKDFLKDNKLPQFKGALIDGAFFDGDSLDTLSSLKTKNEVIGDILGLLLSPMSNVVSALQAQGSNILGAVKTIAEKEN